MKKVFFILFIVFSFLSCSTSRKQKELEKRGSIKPIYQYETLEEGLVAVLLKEPLRWKVSLVEDGVEYGRAFFFFKKYCASDVSTKAFGNKTVIEGESRGARYTFIREELEDKSGFFYEVRVVYRKEIKEKEKAEFLLAANLSRFIREGSLEVEVMDEPEKYVKFMR
ncbi:MAG: hypothetical protein D6780_08095 [Candidatus Dadabacteria bacterium]|nr:MAG: hypothetical protein D6780_08095 [Candidatus Dadabacteria bacterium]